MFQKCAVARRTDRQHDFLPYLMLERARKSDISVTSVDRRGVYSFFLLYTSTRTFGSCFTIRIENLATKSTNARIYLGDQTIIRKQPLPPIQTPKKSILYRATDPILSVNENSRQFYQRQSQSENTSPALPFIEFQ